jgi:hypothetical protein
LALQADCRFSAEADPNGAAATSMIMANDPSKEGVDSYAGCHPDRCRPATTIKAPIDHV